MNTVSSVNSIYGVLALCVVVAGIAVIALGASSKGKKVNLDLNNDHFGIQITD